MAQQVDKENNIKKNQTYKQGTTYLFDISIIWIGISMFLLVKSIQQSYTDVFAFE